MYVRFESTGIIPGPEEKSFHKELLWERKFLFRGKSSEVAAGVFQQEIDGPP